MCRFLYLLCKHNDEEEKIEHNDEVLYAANESKNDLMQGIIEEKETEVHHVETTMTQLWQDV